MNENWKVYPIKSNEVRQWLENKHYARRWCMVSHCFGLFRSGVLRGVCTFGLPPSPQLCSGLLGDSYKNKVLEFNRLCLEDGHEKNLVSWFVSRCLRLLPKPLAIVSFADTGQNHVGYIYQALNFLYTGLTDSGRKTPRSDRIASNGKHGRHQKDKMVPLVYRSQKHRYVMFLGSKKERADMLRCLRYPVMPYPKGESLHYDASYKPVTQVRMCL